MTRHRPIYIAATVAAALLAMLTLGARKDWREPSPETCKTNLEAVFEWCGIKGNRWCRDLDEGEMDACEAGCPMALCPEQITCTDLDPIWCGTSCADRRGARYWSNLWGAHDACEGMFDDLFDEDEVRDLTHAQFIAWMGCIDTHMKQQCPEVTYFRLRQPPPNDTTE